MYTHVTRILLTNRARIGWPLGGCRIRGGPGRQLASAEMAVSLCRRFHAPISPIQLCICPCALLGDQQGPKTCVTDLESLEMEPVLDNSGSIPEMVPESPAVFAIFDKDKDIQYIGFSSTLRKSIEKLFYRRPEKAYYFKYVLLDSVDQDAMVGIRNVWFDSLEAPPVGNVNPVEKDAWQVPTQVVSNSEGGLLVAAQEQAAMMMAQIRNRGCTVDIAPEPALLQRGLIEFVTLTAGEIERIRQEKEKMADMIRHYSFINNDGDEDDFELVLLSELKTNGGFMYDVILMHDSRETSHRVIVGKTYYKHGTFEPEDALGAVFGFILKSGLPRQTEGILSSTQFSANYFSIGEVHQNFSEFESFVPIQIDGDSFWRFRRVEKYGFGRDEEDAGKLGEQFKNAN